MTTFATLQHASYTEAQWTAWNGVLLQGQIAFSTDLLATGTDQMRYKIGNGVDTWTALDYTPDAGSSSGTSTVYITARNTTGSTITKGSIVYVSGATSSKPTIALARANAESTSMVVGVASFDIPNNTNVADNVTIEGIISDIDTSAYTAGDSLYLSSSVAGATQNTSPTTPNFTLHIGHVLYSHAVNGIILVTVSQTPISQNTSLGSSLKVSPSENAVKAYADTKQPALGYTPENSANKDASGGYAGLTLFKINFKNVANTFTSFFTNINTASRTYTFQDRNGTIADDTDLALKAPIASPTFTGTSTTPAIIVSSETASRVAIIDGSKNVKSADTATYPSLTELAYVKGSTSSIQTQLDTKGYTIQSIFSTSAQAPADAQTYYFGSMPSTGLITTAATNRIYIPRAGTVKAIYINFRQTAGSNETSTMYFRLNNTTDTSISASITNDSSFTTFNNTGLSIAVSAGDYFELKWTTPTWGTNPTGVFGSAIILIQ